MLRHWGNSRMAMKEPEFAYRQLGKELVWRYRKLHDMCAVYRRCISCLNVVKCSLISNRKEKGIVFSYQDPCFHWKRMRWCLSDREQTATWRHCELFRNCKRRVFPWWTDREQSKLDMFPVWVRRNQHHQGRYDVSVEIAHYDWWQLEWHRMERCEMKNPFVILISILPLSTFDNL